MNFGFTEEQELLRQEVRKFLDAHCPMAEVRRSMEAAEGHSSELWQRVSALGWPGLAIPEQHGGAGLGLVDLVVLLEETGRSLFPSPLLATTLAAAALAEAGSPEQCARWLPGLAAGSCIGTLAVSEPDDRHGVEGVGLVAHADGSGLRLSGEKRAVLDATSADLFVVAARRDAAAGEPVWLLVESGDTGLAVQDTPSMDRTRRLGIVRFEDLAVPRDRVLARSGEAVLARILDVATAAVTAEMVGAAEGVHALTVEFARQRVQFGRPIGQFQGVKHPLAEAYVDVESFKSLLHYAAWALEERHEDAARAVSMAKAYASDAFARLGIDAIQLHGGVGYTWEYDAQLYLKRSKWARPFFGDAAWHYERVARLGGL